jgi:NAD dependent epimerase/dehydratase
MDQTESQRPWEGKSVLVTGAAGFIGSTLVEWLTREGANVRAFVRYNSRNDFGRLEDVDPGVLDQVEIYPGDLANPEAVGLAVKDCEVVLHLGALIPIPYSFKHAREFVSANVEGTLNVLEACRRWDVKRVVQVSSSEVYGTAQIVPIPESHPLRPQSPYAATKVAADQLALTYWHSFGLPVVLARPFNTYGPRQSARAVIPTVITQALARDRVELGTTSTTRDFLFVEDTARGLARCAEVGGIEGETFNLGTGLEYSIADVVTRILSQIGVDMPVESTDERQRPGSSEVERLLCDPTRAHEILDWHHQVELDEGLAQTIEWMRSNLETFKPTLYNV